MILPYPPHHFQGLLLILFSVNFRNGRGPMPQDNPGGLQSKLLTQERGGVVAELVGMPMLIRLPGGKLLIGHPFGPVRSFNRLGDGMAVGGDGVMILELFPGLGLDVRAGLVAQVDGGGAIFSSFLLKLGHGLRWGKTIALFRPIQEWLQDLLCPRADVNGPLKAMVGRLMLGRAVEPYSPRLLDIAGSYGHQFAAAGARQ